MTSAFPPQEHNPHEWAAMHPDAEILVGSRPIPDGALVGEDGPELVDRRRAGSTVTPSTDQSDEDAPVDVDGDGQLDDYERATKAELVAQCEQRGLPVSGTKAELVARLQGADAESAEGA